MRCASMFCQQMNMDAAPGIYSKGLLICFWVPLLLSRWSGVRGQTPEIIQTPETLSVSAGEEFTLNCILKGIGRPGGVRWYRGPDRNQPAIYTQKDSSSRVTRLVPESPTDFSITISNVRPEDAGTYYCVKYKKTSGTEVEETAGKGTVVSVIATPSQPLIQAPISRVEAGASVTFNCTSDRFSPRDITVTWLKDARPIQPLRTTVRPEGESISYEVWSSVEVQLAKEDAKSQLICQIEHNTLRSPLKQSFSLGGVLRVPPNVRVEIDPPPPVHLNHTVTVTCNVENFYPNDVIVAWPENDKSETVTDESPVQHWDGTFSLKSSLVVKATEERNLSIFTCLVRHNSQPPVNKTATLIIRSYTEGNDSNKSTEGEMTVFIIVAVVCLLLVVLVVSIIYLVIARHQKGKDPTSVRLHEAEKTSGATNQEPDPNNVTYADLNFEKAPEKSPRQVVEISQQSEYASIQAAKPPASDENVTYADLDMVHLSKAPKRPAPKPEETSSEYASVQVQGK
nr:tyrosine-protein phosphatase non-receptor type substrate 1-like isoform X1 [Anolis sagrei ordinatus]